jgi:hypothetical protein
MPFIVHGEPGGAVGRGVVANKRQRGRREWRWDFDIVRKWPTGIE